MNIKEFSNQFDILVNSYRRFRDFDNKEPLDTVEFNEYEKSYYLTKSQDEIVISLYNGKNPFEDSFEKTEELRRYLSNLVAEAELSPTLSSNGLPLGLGSKSEFFTLPEDLWFITYEAVILYEGKCPGHNTLNVFPVTQDEYHRVKKNPFRGTNDRRALRLDLADGVVEIVSDYPVEYYYVRYLKNTTPIILEDLPDDLTIKGESKATECTLHQALHERILEKAVETALQSKGYNIKNENR